MSDILETILLTISLIILIDILWSHIKPKHNTFKSYMSDLEIKAYSGRYKVITITTDEYNELRKSLSFINFDETTTKNKKQVGIMYGTIFELGDK